MPIIDYIVTVHPTLLMTVADNPIVEGYTDIYVYKHSHIKGVIDALEYIPESVKYWYQGKLFGIGDTEIEEFLSSQHHADA
jgi:hypothetical protein